MGIDILNSSAAGDCRFKIYAVGGSIGCHVVCQYISYASGCLASTGYQTCSFSGNAVMDYNVFCRPVNANAVSIASGFDAEIIIVTVNVAILNEYP